MNYCGHRPPRSFQCQRGLSKKFVKLRFRKRIVDQDGCSANHNVRLSIPVQIRFVDTRAKRSESKRRLEGSISVAQQQSSTGSGSDVEHPVIVEVSDHEGSRVLSGSHDRCRRVEGTIAFAQEYTHAAVCTVRTVRRGGALVSDQEIELTVAVHVSECDRSGVISTRLVCHGRLEGSVAVTEEDSDAAKSADTAIDIAVALIRNDEVQLAVPVDIPDCSEVAAKASGDIVDFGVQCYVPATLLLHRCHSYRNSRSC